MEYRLGDVVDFDYDDREGKGIITYKDRDWSGNLYEVLVIESDSLWHCHYHSSDYNTTLHKRIEVGGEYSYWNVRERGMCISSNKLK